MMLPKSVQEAKMTRRPDGKTTVSFTPRQLELLRAALAELQYLADESDGLADELEEPASSAEVLELSYLLDA
jgi:thiamine monophosphate kinase